MTDFVEFHSQQVNDASLGILSTLSTKHTERIQQCHNWTVCFQHFKKTGYQCNGRIDGRIDKRTDGHTLL